MQCKVYVKDVRTIDESLLNNGVVDIAIIDAPGLNSDSLKTTAVFARQEEIDVVVFVVSAANHFTLSAQDFIMNAAHEKAYIFIVVNGFDNIRDKGRCERMILEQVAKLSPQTFKESAELVHFVSSNAIPVSPASLPGGRGGGDRPGPSDDDPAGDTYGSAPGKRKEMDPSQDKGKGKEIEKVRDFENLESALRRFVLDKRSRSKLAPARTYLLNILSDLNILASVNRDVASSEAHRMATELDELVPAYENSKKQYAEISDSLSNSIDDSCDDVYNHTRSSLSTTIGKVAEADLGVEYPGLFSAFQFAEDLKIAMIDQIAASVLECEEYARAKSVHGVNMIQSIGLLHVGEDKFPNLNFRADLMFRQERHVIARRIDIDVDIWDFVDIRSLWERQEKMAGTGMAMTVIGILGGRAFGGVGWVDGIFGATKILGPANVRRMVLPGIIAASKSSILLYYTYLTRLTFAQAILTTAYVLSSIPTSLPQRLSRKISSALTEFDYTHSNAARISAEVRRVLRMPVRRLQAALQVATEDLAKRKEEVGKVQQESEVASKYFANLFRESSENRRTVELVDLEAPLPGAMAAYQS
jgi:mitofusin